MSTQVAPSPVASGSQPISSSLKHQHQYKTNELFNLPRLESDLLSLETSLWATGPSNGGPTTTNYGGSTSSDSSGSNGSLTGISTTTVGFSNNTTAPSTSVSSSASLSSSCGASLDNMRHVWDDIYGTGKPVEVIIISDDEEEEKEDDINKTRPTNSRQLYPISTSNKSSQRYQPQSQSSLTLNLQNRKRKVRSPEVVLDKRKKRVANLSVNSSRQISRPIIKASEVHVRFISDSTNMVSSHFDDKDGHYITDPPSNFTERYQIEKTLGQGTFGKVVSAYDRVTKTRCAIKIIRAVQKYRDASKIELRVLSTLSMYDKSNSNKCIHLRECFDFRNHICIVTDLLGISIYDFLKTNNFLPFPKHHIQAFAAQLLKSVSFLHSLNLIHTDLKPENILLVDSSYDKMPFRHKQFKTRNVLKNTAIHLIDFGSAIFDDEYHSSVVSTRHYRAPEIILGIGWSFPCDIWSIGCILVEFCTGEALFQTHDNLEHLALMQQVIGRPFDRHIVREASSNSTGSAFFNYRSGKLDYPNKDVKKSSEKYVRSVKTLDKIINSTIPAGSRSDPFWTDFLDLLTKIFVYDPKERITAEQALAHPWFSSSRL